MNALYYLRHSPRRIITVGESGNYSLEEIRTHEKKDPVVWVIRRTYSDRDELLDLYAETHSVQEERRWQHVAVLRLERRIQR